MAIKQLNTTISQSPEGKSIAKIREIRGNTLVWNQLVQNGDFSDGIEGWDVYSGTGSVSNGVLTVTNAIGRNGVKILAARKPTLINNHKYYYSVYCQSSVSLAYYFVVSGSMQANSSPTKIHGIATPTNSGNSIDFFPYSAGTQGTFSLRDIQIIDLTLMFGAGNEPETIEEFEAMFPENYYEYNSGEIINSNINAIETVGFNQWDEEWEGGYYNQGQKVGFSSSNRIRCKNPIRCLPSTIYKLTTIGEKSDTTFSINFLNRNGGYISSTNVTNNTFTTPNNCYFFVFATSTTYYGNTYNHNICINLSDPSRNGTYEPYKTNTIELNLPTLTGKLNGEGESVVIASDGLKSAGTAYDYGVVENGYITKIVKVIGEVDMGTLTWTLSTSASNIFYTTDSIGRKINIGKEWFSGNGLSSKYLLVLANRPGWQQNINTLYSTDKSYCLYNSSGGTQYIHIHDSSYSDVATFKTAMSGVMLNYELATPQTYVLDTPILMEYNTDGGTEQIVFSENLLSTPLVADIDYFNSAIKHIQFNEEKHCIRDERITGIDYIPIEHSTNVVTSAGVYNAIPVKGVKIFYGTCDTAAETAAKVVVCPEFTENDLESGTIIYVKFQNTNTAAVADLTLNVNDTGAIGIRKLYNTSLTTLTSAGELRGTIYQFIYHERTVDNETTVAWKLEGLDYNRDTVGYTLRTNYTNTPVRYKFYRYRLLFYSPDNTELIPANTSSSTNATAKRDVIQDKINPFGPILYYATTTAINAGDVPSTSYRQQQASLSLGYSFNRTGAALTLSVGPVYLKCAPQTDGSAIIDADIPYVQALPNTDDGKIYIYLGQAYDATHVELVMCHPIYYYKDGTIRIWTNNGCDIANVTYSNLVSLRNNSKLTVGKKYRITDYVATTTDSESRSVGHQFDIIVTALGNNILSEEAHAYLHEGDSYFANTNLNAWKVWYCLDNDTSRFSWADTTNGKGVVYRLIDEYLNDVPYDFKSIQFKRYKVTAKTEYPELTILNGFYIGLSGTLSFGLNINTSDFKWYYTFSVLGSAWTDDVTDASLTGTGCGTTTLEQTSYNGLLRDLNNVVFANGPVAKARRSSIYPDLSDAINIETVSINCYFGLNANNNTFVGNTTNSYMQSQCRNNITFGSGFRHSTISSDVQNNTIAVAGDFSFNRFEGGSSDGNIIVSTRNVTGNRFASSFRDNRINTDNNFTNNVFEGATLRNTFITAGTSEQIAYNTFESNFSDNTINCGLLSNRFGNSFYNNTIGTAASGAYIQSNDFGPYIHHNNFGNYFNFNRMLGQISYCSFGTYVFQCQFDPIMSYVDISNGTTSTMFSNVHVCGNIRGTSSVHISLDDSNFRVNGVSGVKRHITISGDTNGDITATWMSDDKLEGVYKTNGDALWTIMASAPQVNIPGNLPKKEIYDDSKRLVDVQGKYLSTNNTMENTAGPASVTKIYLVPCNEDLYIDIYGVTNSAAIPAAFRGVSSPFTIWKSYDFNHPGRWLRRETVRLDSSTQGDRANLYLFGSGGSPANLYKVQKILFLGSSWHMNTWWYLNKMFADANIVADIHGYYMGHSQFIEWTQLYNNDLTPLTGDEANRDARYCTSINGSDWTSYVFKDTFGSEPSTLTAQQYRDAFYNDLTSNDWDIIAFQQGANQAPYWEYWAHYKDLLSVLKRHCNKDTVLAFNATWAPAIDNYRLDTFGGRNSLASQKLWQKLNNACTQRFINESGIETVAPNGAMLWAMRQNSSLNVSGANDLTSDGIHPRHGVAMYGLAGCWWDTYIAPMYGIAFKDLSWYPDSNTQKIHFNGTSFQTISSTQLELIRKCVKVAQSDRFGFRTV